MRKLFLLGIHERGRPKAASYLLPHYYFLFVYNQLLLFYAFICFNGNEIQS
jgi:hypothetical protein